VVLAVLVGEGAGETQVTVTFLSSARMRALNRRTFRRDRATDVIGFTLPHPGALVGDVYVCPGVARRSAAQLNVRAQEELIRLVVHGTLHVLGYDHPSGKNRIASPMWKVQERYVAATTGTAK
jgi:probable rRNA maturation factor